MSNYVITITRQFGSLGRPVAKRMSELLNIDFFDRDIVEATAKKMNTSVKEVSNNEETVRKGFFYMKSPLGSGTTETQDLIFQAQSKIINELADKQSCIIVGRCSDYILQNRKNSIHIFIYAPVQERIKNCLDYLHMNESDAIKMIKDVDEARERYHMHYAKFPPSDWRYKDIMVNSALLGMEGTAQELARFVTEKGFDK